MDPIILYQNLAFWVDSFLAFLQSPGASFVPLALVGPSASSVQRLIHDKYPDDADQHRHLHVLLECRKSQDLAQVLDETVRVSLPDQKQAFIVVSDANLLSWDMRESIITKVRAYTKFVNTFVIFLEPTVDPRYFSKAFHVIECDQQVEGTDMQSSDRKFSEKLQVVARGYLG